MSNSLQQIKIQETKYKEIIPSSEPLTNSLPEKNSIKNNHKIIKILFLKNETKKIIVGKITIILADLTSVPRQISSQITNVLVLFLVKIALSSIDSTINELRPLNKLSFPDILVNKL